jgi:hypothetical protein
LGTELASGFLRGRRSLPVPPRYASDIVNTTTDACSGFPLSISSMIDLPVQDRRPTGDMLKKPVDILHSDIDNPPPIL